MLLLRSSTSQPREQIHEKNSKSGLNLRENLHTVELKFVKDPLTLKKKKKCGKWKIDETLFPRKLYSTPSELDKYFQRLTKFI